MSAASPALAEPALSDPDLLRSRQYAFLSRLLGAAPDAALLGQIAAMTGDATPLGRAYGALAQAAARTTPAAVGREFFELFVGVGRGELLPYASFYLTGFLNERPLAELRRDLARLGVVRADGRHEPEDHMASVCEVMAGLASGRFAADGADEAAFFARHLAPWAGQFFDDLAVAPSAGFYRPVAEIGRTFVDIETRAFALGA
jgi:TorA maturation chaperone TorD